MGNDLRCPRIYYY
jgi:hypothetical protein